MRENQLYLLIADVVLTLHFAIAVFVVAGLVLVIIGNLCNWRWVNNLWFRLAHIGAIVVVMTETLRAPGLEGRIRFPAMDSAKNLVRYLDE